MMKKSALLINTARGGIVDEEALIECLTERRVAGAGLDVFVEEPISPQNPLLHLDNVVLTPHIAGSAWESVHRTLEVSVENIQRVASGDEAQNLVSEG
jgi:phosphoglycerate dehydrogenase-like enzyme